MAAPVSTRRSILTTAPGTNLEAFGLREWALFVAVGVIWGSSFLLMAVGLEVLHPGVITWLRVGLGAGTLALIPRARRPVDRSDLPRLLVLSVLWVAVPFTLFPIAEQWITSAVTGMLNGGMPIFTAVIASLLLKRAPRPAQLAGLVVGFAGVVAISLPSLGRGSSQALGVLLVVAATVCYAFAVNIAAPLQQRYGSLPIMARMLAVATVLTTPFGLVGLSSSRFAWGPALAQVVLGVVNTGLAFVLMGNLVGRVGSTRASFITYLIPVVALVLGVVFLSEQVAPLAVAGVGLVIVGALLASRREG